MEMFILIQVFRIDDHITKIKDVRVVGKCRGITYLEDKLVVGYRSPIPRVEMLTEDGVVLKTLTSSPSGDQQFRYPYYIQVANTMDTTIIVSDWGQKTIYMLDGGLQLLKTFQLPSGGSPFDLAAVGVGQVLVVDRGTDTLQLLDITTGRWRTLLGKKKGKGWPECLAYNQSYKRILVGCDRANNVKVYTLS